MAPQSGWQSRAPALTDRHSERAALDRLLGTVRAGQSQVLVIRGDPGVGKTALLDYLAQRASGCRASGASGSSARWAFSRKWSWPSPGCISCALRC